jgi:hypothetical protein
MLSLLKLPYILRWPKKETTPERNRTIVSLSMSKEIRFLLENVCKQLSGVSQGRRAVGMLCRSAV